MARKNAKQAQTGNSDRRNNGILLNIPACHLATDIRPFVVEYFPTREQRIAEEHARKRELQLQYQNAKRALATVRKEWWKRDEVTGLSVWYRTQRNEVVSPLQYVIQVDVRRKMGEDALKKQKIECFPKSVCGKGKNDWPVAVKVCERRYVAAIERGIPLTGTGTGAIRTNQIRGGIAIASTASPGNMGTLGVCLPHETSNGISLVGVTNQHVAKMPHEVISLSGTTRTTFASIAKSSRDQSLLKRVLPGHTLSFLEGLSNPDGDPGTKLKFMMNDSYEDGDTNVDLWKVGAKTGYTKGYVTQNSAPIDVDELGVFNDVIRFQGISTTVFLRGGDSGSVLVAKLGNDDVVIGLIFAEEVSTNIGAAIPFGRVIAELGIDIPSARQKWI